MFPQPEALEEAVALKVVEDELDRQLRQMEEGAAPPTERADEVALPLATEPQTRKSRRDRRADAPTEVPTEVADGVKGWRPYVSVVLAARNDKHEGDFIGRLQASVIALAELVTK